MHALGLASLCTTCAVLAALFVVLSAEQKCPVGTSTSHLEWAPLAWRPPMDVCRCPPSTYCRGPHCHAQLDYATNKTIWTAFALGCDGCQCLPLCTSSTACWDPACVCAFTMHELYSPRDPTKPHSPSLVADALRLALPSNLISTRPYDDRYRNPCWYEREENVGDTFRCMPFAYIPGILKCATSALYDTLQKHPQVTK